MTFVWLSKKRSTLEKCHHHKKKCNIFYHFYLWKYSNKNIGNDGFLLAFFSFHSGWHSCQDILYIQNVFRYCTRGFVHKSVYTCIINGPGVSKIEKGQWNISNFPLKFWSVFVKFEISHWHQSDSELEPLLFMTRLFRISGSSFICLISFCNNTVLLISISWSFFIFTWFFFRSSCSFVIVLTVFSSSILIEVSSVRIWYNNVTSLLRELLDVILTEKVIHLLILYVALTGDDIYAGGSLYKRFATPNTEWNKTKKLNNCAILQEIFEWTRHFIIVFW